MARMQVKSNQLKWLAREYRQHRIPALTQRFNAHWGTDYCAAQIRNCLNRYQILSGRAPGFRPGERWVTWSPAMVAWLRQHRADDVIAVVTARLNARFGTAFKPNCVGAAAKRFGITAASDGRYAPGVVPWNTGLTGYDAGGRSAETRFRPGHSPQTEVPVWTYSQDPAGYWKLKVRDDAPSGFARRNWMYLHRLTWIGQHGPIPPGHVVVMVDGDPDHCLDLDNLACINRNELARLNQMGWRALRDPALRRAAIDLVRLHCATIARTSGRRERKALVPPLGSFAG